MERLDELLGQISDNRWLQVVLILLASLVLAKLAEWVLTRLVTVLTRRTKTEADDQLVELLRRPVFITVLLAGLVLVTRRVGLPEGVEAVTGRLLWTLALLVWVGFSFRFAHLGLSVLARHQDKFAAVEARTLPLFENLAKILLVGLAGYGILLVWGADVSGWLASAGIVGIAVGFAAKDTLANLFSGVFILADAPYKLGDFVNLDTGERGQVTQIGIRSTRLLTRDDVEITIPNAVIANAKIINETGGRWERERVRVRVGVAYGSDIDQVRQVLEAVPVGVENVLQGEPGAEPRVRFRSFGASSLDFELLCWIEKPVLRGRVLDALNSRVYKAFVSEGIEIPYAKQDVYIKEMPPLTVRGDESAKG